jgi:hypothetical protein
MSIVSSEIIEQLDLGHMWQVREQHIDSQGTAHHWLYHPGKTIDLNAKLAEHAETLEARLIAQEIDEVLGG